MAPVFLAVFSIVAASLLVLRCSAQLDLICEVCSYWTTVPPPTPVYPTIIKPLYYGFADDVCYRFIEPLTKYIDDPMSRKLSWEDFNGMGYGGSLSCNPDEFQRCGTFNSSALALKYKSTIISGLKTVISKWLCPVVRGAYGITVSSSSKYRQPESDYCIGFDYNVTIMCPKPKPFPTGACNKTAGILPVTVTNITKSPGSSGSRMWSCLNITSASNKTVGGSCGVSKITQAEIWADDNLRRAVTAVRITKNGGTPSLMTPTWGPLGSNTLRVPLNWNMTEANGGEICFETDPDIDVSSSSGTFATRLVSLCIGGKCYVSLYNDKKNCCPVYEAEFPDDVDWYGP